MKLAAIIDWIDDRLNPIVVKELRQAVKSRMVVGILGLFLIGQLLLLGGFLLTGEASKGSTAAEWTAGLRVFIIQQGILLFTIMVAVPGYACIRLGNERTENNVDLMFISTLRPASIIWGKFFAAFVLGLLVFSTCAPFMTFAYLLRGIDMPTILVVLGIDLLAMSFGTMVALFVASIPGGRGVKVFFSFSGFVGLIFLCFGLMGGMYDLMQFGVFERVFDNWYAPLVVLVGVGGVVGLLFFYSVALISPPTANRILPLRVFLLAAWLALGVSMFATSRYVLGGGAVTPFPVMGFMMISTLFLCVQLWISIGERSSWGPRVARTIPTSVAARPVAFLFYTGSAGGILYSVGLILITLVGSMLWSWWYRGGTYAGWDSIDAVIRFCAVVALYGYCYGISAVLVRQWLLANQVKSSYTWLIGLLLIGLGSAVPSLVAYIAFHDQVRYHSGDPGWWSLANPLFICFELFGKNSSPFNSEYELTLGWFLCVWAVLVSVVWMPSLLGQIARFKPVPKRLDYAPPLELIEQAVGGPSEAKPAYHPTGIQSANVGVEGQS